MWAPALCPDPPKKGLVSQLPIRWRVQWISSVSVSVGHGSGRVLAVDSPFPPVSGGHPPGFYPLRSSVYCLAPEAPVIKGMPTEPYVFLENAGCVWAPALHPDPPKKSLVLHLSVWWGVPQIPSVSISVSDSVQFQRSLSEPLPRAVIFLIVKLRRGFS